MNVRTITNTLPDSPGDAGRTEQLFRLFAENSQDIIYRYRLAPQPGFEYVSPAATEITGYTPKEHYADPQLGFKIVHPDDRHLLESASGGENVSGQPITLRWVRKDGTVIWTEQRNRGVYDAEGALVAIDGVAREVTKQMEAEQSLQQERERFQVMLRNMSDAIAIIDTEGIMRYQSPSVTRMLGYKPEKLIGKSGFEFIHPDDRMALLDQLREGVDQPGLTLTFTYRFRHKNGTWRLMESTGTNLLDHPIVQGIVLNTRDITEQKRAEESLYKEKILIDAMMDNIPDSIYFKNRDSQIIRLNRAMMENLGIDNANQAIGKTDFELFGDEFGQKTRPEERHLIKTGQAIIGKVERRKLEDGRENWTSTTKAPLRDADGQVIGLVGITREINDIKEAELALQKSEQRYRGIFEGVRDAIFVESPKGEILDVNQAACEMFGYSQEEFLSKTVADLAPPDQPAFKFEKDTMGMPTQPVETINIRSNGERFPVEISGQMHTIDDEEVMLVVVRDITQRKEAKIALKKAAAEWKTTFNATTDGIYVLDNEQQILRTNQALETIVGKTQDEIIGKPCWEVLHGTDEPIPDCPVTRMKESKQRERLEYNIADHWLEFVADPIFDDRGALTGAVHAVRDITKQKQAQRDLERRAEEFASLYEISQAFGVIKDTHEVTAVLTEKLAHLVGAEICVLALLDPSSDMIEAQAPGYGLSNEHIAQIRYERTLGLEVWNLDHQDAFVADSQEEIPAGFLPLARQLDVHAVVMVALPIARKFGGVIFAANKPGGFTAEDEHILEMVASQVGVVVEKAELFKTTQRQLDEMHVLHAVAKAAVEASTEEELIARATEAIGESLYPDNAGVLLVDESSQNLVVSPSYRGISEETKQLILPIGDGGVATHVAATGKPCRIPDISRSELYFAANPGMQSELCVPLKIGERVIGVINAESAQLDAFSQDDERLLTTLAGQLATAIERLRNERAERDQRILAEALRDTASALNSSLNVDKIMDRILENVGRVVPFDSANIILIEEDTAHVARHAGYAERGLDAWIESTQFDTNETPTLQYLTKKRHPLLIPDVRSDDRWVAIPETQWIGSYLAAPICKDEVVLGIINLDHTAPGFFEQDHTERLQAFADQVAIGLDNARLFDETHRRLEEMEMVNRVSIALRSAQTLDEMLPIFLDETLNLFDTSVGNIALYDELEDMFVTQVPRGWFENFPDTLPPQDQGISGQVLKTRKPYLFDDFANDPLSNPDVADKVPAGWGGACLPIFTGQTIIGLLYIAVETPRRLTQTELKLLATLNELIGSAIHRTRLHEQTQQQVRRLAALRTIDNTIKSSLNLELTLDIFLKEVIAQLGVDAADVLLFNPDTHILEHAAGRGFRFGKQQKKLQLRLGESQAGKAALTREIIAIPEVAALEETFAQPESLAGEDVAAYFAVPLIAKGQLVGVMQVFKHTPLVPDQDWLDFLQMLAGQAAIAIDNTRLFNGLQRSNQQLASAYDSTLEGWARALELRDMETEGHSRRVTEMTMKLSKRVGLPSEQLVHIRRGALLHDIGKMGIPDSILGKPGPLTDEEWVLMHQHPQHAYDMLKRIDFLRPALDIPYCHHEKWDGTGYPRGLKGEHIPLPARIFAVVDVWDALLSDRPYRRAWPEEKVLAYLKSQSGTHFDPGILKAFLELVE